MSELRTYQLGELCEITSSKRIFYEEYVSSGVPFYRSKEIIELANNQHVSTDLFITETRFREISEKFGHPQKDDILLTSVGTLGQAYLVSEKDKFYFKDGNLTWFKNWKSFVLPKYVLCWIKSKQGQQALLDISIGSTQAALTISGLKTLEINIPSIDEQQAIAEVLSSLDDKIDLLHRNNKTLEQMAETLFRQWFVEEAKEEWENGVLGDLVTVKRGGSPRPIQDYLAETGLRWLKISDVTNVPSPYVFEIKEHIKKEGINKTVLLKAGALIVSNSATPGIPKILSVDSCIHDGWLYFPQSRLSNEFLYLFFLKIKTELVSLGNGSIFTNLKTDIVRTFPLVKPDEKTLSKFDELVKPLFEKMYNNAVQLMKLTETRDTLLPKLMSGQVRVNIN